jgi:rhodanese-related sulfurtransferase
VSKGKALLIDVREQAEWDAGHVSFAKLIPLSQLHANAESAAETLPKDTILYLHCRAGVRCLTAAAILEKAGYSVRPVRQGYRELQKAGFPVEVKT